MEVDYLIRKSCDMMCKGNKGMLTFDGLIVVEMTNIENK